MNEMELNEQQILKMVADTAKNLASTVMTTRLVIMKSDSYGPHLHRTWVFLSDEGTCGTIERYWGGLKLICSVLGGTPRTSFFMEDGTRTTNKGLKEANSQRREQG